MEEILIFSNSVRIIVLLILILTLVLSISYTIYLVYEYATHNHYNKILTYLLEHKTQAWNDDFGDEFGVHSGIEGQIILRFNNIIWLIPEPEDKLGKEIVKSLTKQKS